MPIHEACQCGCRVRPARCQDVRLFSEGPFTAQLRSFSFGLIMKTILAGVSLLLLSCGPLRASDRPNIVFFFADDQTTSTLGCYGNTIVQTPNIDALAARGTRFENAFVSQSICWVSRTTILTGLTGRSYGTAADPEQARPDAVQTLYADILRANCYRTGYFGKWHAKMPNGYRAQDHFDAFEAIGRSPYYKQQPDGSLRHET